MSRKSAASTQLEGPRKMQKTMSDLDFVVAALQDTAGGPSDMSTEALGMLVDAAPFALAPAPHHAHVDAIAEFMRTALEGPKAQALELASAASARTEEARAELEAVEQAQGEAIDAANAAKGATQAATKAIRRAEFALKQSETDLEAANTSHAERLSARKCEEADGQQALEMLECHFSALVSGITDADGHLDKVTRFLQMIGAEETLVVSVPAICGKPVAERTQWDLLALEECKRALEKHQVALRTKIQAAVKAEREAEAEALGESAIQWVNARRVAESRALHDDAKVKEAAADEQVSKTFETVGTHQTIVEYLLEQSNRCDERVQEIEQSLQAFDRLRNPASCPTEELKLADYDDTAAEEAQHSAEDKAVPHKEKEETLVTTLLSKPTPCR